MNEKGEAFASFRLLIGAIIGLVIMFIIMGAVSYFEDLKQSVVTRKITDSLNSAVQNPDGKQIKIEKMEFQKNTSFSKKGFSNATGIEEECISIETEKNGILKNPNSINPNSIVFSQAMTTDVFISCEQSFNPNCSGKIECKISFGKALKALD